MAKLTEEMRDLIGRCALAYVATTDEKGRPNVSPKGMVKILNDESLVFADLFSLKTRQNLKENSQVAIAIIDPKAFTGFQFKGRAEVIEEGPLYDEIASHFEANSPVAPPRDDSPRWYAWRLRRELARNRPWPVRPNAVVVVHLEEIWNLAPGHATQVWR